MSKAPNSNSSHMPNSVRHPMQDTETSSVSANITDIISQFMHQPHDEDDEHECCSCPEHMKR